MMVNAKENMMVTMMWMTTLMVTMFDHVTSYSSTSMTHAHLQILRQIYPQMEPPHYHHVVSQSTRESRQHSERDMWIVQAYML